MLTNLNYSLICNTKAATAELVLYEIILFSEIIYSGDLLMVFINNMEGVPKDESILLISITIANQILIMDLMFRAAYEDKEREKEREMHNNELNVTTNKILPEVHSLQELESTKKI